MVVRGTARAPAQNRPELCVGQAESKPGQGERRAPPLCGHGNRPARGGCAGRGALAPTPRKRRPLHARYLYYIVSARPAQASAGTARQNLQRRNRQAEPYCRTRRPRRSKKICLPPLTMPQPHAILIKFPAGKTSYRGVEQMVARRAHNPEVAGSSPVPATILIGRFYCRPIFYCCIAEYWRLRACRVQAFSITVTSVFGRFWQ